MSDSPFLFTLKANTSIFVRVFTLNFNNHLFRNQYKYVH
ncbi:hypothetical protein CU016_1505 [Enterococcus lactis]|nr:hypothetical protein [Enterococcus lactis]